MRDLRQNLEWGEYLSSIGWNYQIIDNNLVLIKKLPFGSIIKIQRPKNPVPFLEIDSLAKKNNALFVLIEPEINHFSEGLFLENGFKKSFMRLTHSSTIQIDLTKKEEEIFKGFSENGRRNIKKAQNNNLKTEIIYLKDIKNLEDEFNKFYSLLKNLLKIKKFYSPSSDELFKKMTALKDISALVFAYADNTPIAVVWVSFYHNKVSYLHTGITEKGYQVLANYLLVWEIVKKFSKLGFKVFDFEGIYDPRFPKERKKWINFSQFKSRFHGTFLNYPSSYIKIYNPLFKLFYYVNKKIYNF